MRLGTSGKILLSTLTSIVILHASFVFGEEGIVLSSLPNRILEQIFRDGLLETSAEQDVWFIANHFARRTQFAGKVRVNKVPAEGALNIYIFRHSERLPNFIKNNCTTFPGDNVILCDQKMFNSIPLDILPRITETGGLPLLLSWLIGHEIGHLVFRHDQSSFLSFAAYSNSNLGHSIREKNHPGDESRISKDLRNLNPNEVDADRFAISSLPFRSELSGASYWAPLSEAMLWERDKVSSQSSHTKSKQVVRQLIEVEVTEGRHPPMILRLHDLWLTFKAHYADAPRQAKWLRDDAFKNMEFKIVEKKRDGNKVHKPAGEDDGLFYGGAYSRRSFIPRRNEKGEKEDNEGERVENRRVLLDRAVLLRLQQPSIWADHLLATVCKDATKQVQPWSWQHAIVCGDGIDDLVANPAQLGKCEQLEPSQRARCADLIPLIVTLCREGLMKQPGQPLCGNTETLVEIYRTYLDASFPMPEDRYSFIAWEVLTRYEFARSVMPLTDDEYNQWVLANAEIALEIAPDVSLDLLLRHAAYLRTLPEQDVWGNVVEIEDALAKLADSFGDDVGRVSHRRAITVALRKHLSPDHPELGHQLRLFATALRQSQVRTEGNGEPLVMSSTNATEIRQAQQLHEEAIQVSTLAADTYMGALRAAERNGDHKNVPALQAEYVNSLGDIVFSSNLAMQSRAALTAARQLMEVMPQMDRLKELSDYEVLIVAPAFENCAVALLADEEGDVELAARLAKKALEYRRREEKEDASILTSLRMFAFALHSLGHEKETRQMANWYVKVFEKVYYRKVSMNEGALVKGKLVRFGELLGDIRN